MFALHEKLNKFTKGIQYWSLFVSNPKRVSTCKMNIKIPQSQRKATSDDNPSCNKSPYYNNFRIVLLRLYRRRKTRRLKQIEAEYLLMSATEEIKLTRTGISYKID